MREQKPIEYENEPCWDSGTYQTGTCKPKKGQNVTVTVLLMAVIFLGGITSALGVMNVRLVRELLEQQDEAVNLAAESAEGEQIAAYGFFHNDSPRGVMMPEEEVLELRMGVRVEEPSDLCRSYWEISEGLQIVAVVDVDSTLQEGDILVSLNNVRLTELSQLYEAVESAEEKEKLHFCVLRAGKYFFTDIILDE